MNRFEAWLATTDFGVTVKEFPQGTRTASDAARAVGCELGQIVKSLVFMAGASPVIALMSGPNRLDEASLAALVGGPVSKADAETARVATGYSIGGVPPFRHATEVPVFMVTDLRDEHARLWRKRERYRATNANVDQIARQIARVEDRIAQRIKELVPNDREAVEHLRRELEAARGQRYTLKK